jgi:hypothetical protein
MVQTYGAEFNDTTRADLITPCRMGGRFGAIALYLGYRANSATPSYYILEAGLATGAPVRLFPSKDMGTITSRPTGYFPTPFVEGTNTYDGALTMAPNGVDPETLVVRSFREPRTAVGWRVQVTVNYVPRTATDVDTTAPGDLTLMAAERIAAIANGLGEQAIDLQGILAAAGNLLKWTHHP